MEGKTRVCEYQDPSAEYRFLEHKWKWAWLRSLYLTDATAEEAVPPVPTKPAKPAAGLEKDINVERLLSLHPGCLSQLVGHAGEGER